LNVAPYFQLKKLVFINLSLGQVWIDFRLKTRKRSVVRLVDSF